MRRAFYIWLWGVIFAARAFAGIGLNDAFGLPIWQDSNLWDDSLTDTATGLGIGIDKEKPSTTYMRMFAPGIKVLGARAYSIHLYSSGGKMSQVIIAFANKADMVNEAMVAHKDQPSYKQEDALMEISGKWSEEIKKSKEAIQSKLLSVAGSPKQSGNTLSWNWNNHLIELSEKDSSLSLSVVSANPSVSSAPQAGSSLYTNVKTLPNGDVVIQNIPPIDQGPRGFCAPAAWEKCLRYYGLNLNVYELADAGGTGAGGTQLVKLASSMIPILQPKGYQVELLKESVPTVETISAYIDKGYPVIWGMDAKDLDKWIDFNKARTPMGLPKSGAPAIPNEKPSGPITTGHAITIVGYSRRSQEIALSDTRSASPEFQLFWIPLDYIRASSLGERLLVIKPGTGSSSGSSATPPSSTMSIDPQGRKRF